MEEVKAVDAKVVDVKQDVKQAITPKPKAKKKAIKPASQTVITFANKNVGEIDKVRLTINGKVLEFATHQAHSIDVAKLDAFNPEVLKLFIALSKAVNKNKHRLSYKNVSGVSLGLAEVKHASHKCLVGHYHQDGDRSLIIQPFVCSLDHIQKLATEKGLISFKDKKGFVRLSVNDNVPAIVATVKAIIGSIQ